jgi:DNA repair protein RecN (Recombination protein N)
MLHEMHIQNYAVIDTLKVEFSTGLNLLSGETGSGKSILVDALGLALGGRASPDVIRTGQDRALVTAVFREEGRPPWSDWLEEYGLTGGNEPELILRREIQAGGKSRMLVNDQPVTLAAVKSLAGLLVEMHGQNEHVALFARQAQLDLLDQFAGVEDELEGVRELHARRRELESEFEGLSQNE